jgi:hypothetical protein
MHWQFTRLERLFAELFAIWRVVRAIEIHANSRQDFHAKHFVIRSDSQAALQSLARPRQQSGQHIITSILNSVHQLKARQIRITFSWIPAHAGNECNEAAHSSAHEATAVDRVPQIATIPHLRSSTLRCARTDELKPMAMPSDHLYFAKQVDQALPGKHTRLLYDSLIKSEARILVQMRTGKCQLNGYLARIKAVASDQCACGRGPETVKHFLFQCSQWEAKRDKMKRAFPERFGDLAFWIGGWSNQRQANGQYVDGQKSKWKPNLMAVREMLEFVKATRRLNNNNSSEEQT